MLCVAEKTWLHCFAQDHVNRLRSANPRIEMHVECSHEEKRTDSEGYSYLEKGMHHRSPLRKSAIPLAFFPVVTHREGQYVEFKE
jgi:hypothetical protein